MASTISAGLTTTTALVYSADTSGVLQLQTNGTTAALTIDTSQNVTFTGKLTSASSLVLASNGTTTAVTIDTAQNVGVGVTPSAWSASNGKAIEVGAAGNGLYGYGPSNLNITCNAYYNGTNFIYSSTASASYYNQSAGLHKWYNAPSGTAGNTISFTQAMTLDASGNLLVGTTSGSGGRLVSVIQSGFNPSGADNWKKSALQGQGSYGGTLSFVNTGGGSDGFCFYLINNPSTLYIQYGANAGGLSNGVQMASTATSWGSASDERLKTTITPFSNALEKVFTLRAGTGRFLTDAENFSRSFLIAQDVQKVLPEAVDVGQDELQTLSLRYQDLIPLITASIQELSAKVTALEAKVGA